MNIRTMKQLPLLISLSLLAACSTQTTSVSRGDQGSAGSQSTPGSQLFSQQSTNKTAQASTARKPLPVPISNNNMRRVVLKAPKRTITSTAATNPFSNTSTRVITSKPVHVTQPYPVVRKPTPIRKPVVTRPYNTGLITNPARPPVKKPQSTLRRLTLNGSANFKSSSSKLTPAGKTKLLALALSLQEGNTKISRLLIEGHTDSVGDAAMNQVLSLKRANTVADYLAEKGGFARSTIETVGLGESKPVASNKTSAGRALNRRVEIAATGTRQINR